jgi:hypothetical protein
MRMLALLAVGGLITTAGAQDGTPAARGEGPDKKVAELRKERIATLREAADLSLKLAQSARLEVGEAMEDRMALLTAELDAAGKDADRVALYQQTLGSLRVLEEVARARVEAGRGTTHAVLRVKARRLEVEIRLEQAKARGAR